jgi:hypothetical protein
MTRDDLDDLHAAAVTIRCTYCGAGIGELCVNRRSPEQTTCRVPHAHRLRDSTEVPF